MLNAKVWIILAYRMVVIYLLLCSHRQDFGNSVSREVSLSKNAFR